MTARVVHVLSRTLLGLYPHRISVQGRKPANGESEIHGDELRCNDANSLAVHREHSLASPHQSPCKAPPHASSETNYKEREFRDECYQFDFSLMGRGRRGETHSVFLD